MSEANAFYVSQISIVFFDSIMHGKMNVYLFVSRWNRFELLIATFRLQYC